MQRLYRVGFVLLLLLCVLPSLAQRGSGGQSIDGLLLKMAADTGNAESKSLYASLLWESGKEPPPPVPGEFTRIPIIIVIVIATLLVLFLKRNELEFELPGLTGRSRLLTGVLQGPDFQLDVRYRGSENLSGTVLCEGKTVRVKLEKGMPTSHWLRGLLGKFSGAYGSPDSSVLERIEKGERSGRPISLVPFGDHYRAQFDFDFGPASESFYLVYWSRKRVLEVRSEISATCWDGDSFSAQSTSQRALTLKEYRAACEPMRVLLAQCWRHLEEGRYKELHSHGRVLWSQVEAIAPPAQAQAHHEQLLSLSQELTFVGLTAEATPKKRADLDARNDKFQALDSSL